MNVCSRFGSALCFGALALLGACAQTPGKHAEPGLEIAPVYRVTHAKGIELAAAERKAKPARGTPSPAPTSATRPSRAAEWALVPVSANVYELRAAKDESLHGEARADEVVEGGVRAAVATAR